MAADARAITDEQAPFTIYAPYWEWPPWEVALVVRTAGSPRAVAAGMQALIRRLDLDIAIPHAETMHEMLSEAVAPRRFNPRVRHPDSSRRASGPDLRRDDFTSTQAGRHRSGL